MDFLTKLITNRFWTMFTILIIQPLNGWIIAKGGVELGLALIMLNAGWAYMIAVRVENQTGE